MSLIKRIFGNLPNGKFVAALGAAYLLNTSTANAFPATKIINYPTKSTVGENYVLPNQKNLSVINNGIVLQDTTNDNYVFPVTINPDTELKLSKYFASCVRKTPQIFVETPENLERAIGNIGDCYTQQCGKRILKGILQDSTFADASCMKTLDDALKDGVIKPRELYDEKGNLKIQDGIYVLGIICPQSKKTFPNFQSETFLRNSIYTFIHILPYDNGRDKEQKDKPNKKHERKEFADKPEKKHPELKLIAGGTFGLSNNGFKGAQLGLQYGPVALLMNYSQAGDENILNVNDSLSAGRTGNRIEKNTEFQSIGFSAEAHLGHFFVGRGPGYWFFNDDRKLRIVSPQGETLKAKRELNSKNQWSTRFYGGLDVVNGKSGFRVYGGKDDRKGGFIGADATWQFGSESTQQKIPNKRDHRRKL